jgi:hypothetical protein
MRRKAEDSSSPAVLLFREIKYVTRIMRFEPLPIVWTENAHL